MYGLNYIADYTLAFFKKGCIVANNARGQYSKTGNSIVVANMAGGVVQTIESNYDCCSLKKMQSHSQAKEATRPNSC